MNCATCSKPLRRDNTHGYCRTHRNSYKSKYNKNYREKNRDKLVEYSAQYYSDNKEEMKADSRIQSKLWYENNKQKKFAYGRNKRATDLQHKIKCNLRTRLYQAIRNEYKAGSAVSDLGCTVEEFKIYIETLFQEGMTWENWSREVWHLDHIKCLDSFDLTDRDQLLIACHYTNLQPLWAHENIAKSNK